MLILKLFIIPWIWIGAQNIPNGAIVGPAPHAVPNPQIDSQFYNFLQRQSQINNAILLNNAMLANALTVVPPPEHQIPIAGTLQFPSAAAPLHPDHAALFTNLQPKFPTVPATTGFDRLGIYDALNQPVKFAVVPDMLIPAQATTSVPPPTSRTTISAYGKEVEKEETQDQEPIPIGVSEPDESTKKVIDLSAASRLRDVETTETPALTELFEEIGVDNLVTTTTERDISSTTSKKPQQDVYRLLKTLNLTEEETNNLVSQVEKAVREELVRKLNEAHVIEQAKISEKPPTSTANTVTTTGTVLQASTTVGLEDFEARITIPLRRTKPEKELLLYIPRKKPITEIKHHPPRLNTEDRTDFVEAEIFTSRMHLPIEEEKSDDDISEPAVMPRPDSDAASAINEALRATATSTITVTTTPATPSTKRLLPSTAPPVVERKINIKELNLTVKEPSSPRRSHGGLDADLLNMEIVTGAPLDLESEGNNVVAYRTRNVNRISSTTPSPPVFQRSVVGRTKTTSHPKTPFERLVVDYKERLTGAGDMDKFLKTLYSNAYIALIDAKEASSVRIPLSMRRAQAVLG